MKKFNVRFTELDDEAEGLGFDIYEAAENALEWMINEAVAVGGRDYKVIVNDTKIVVGSHQTLKFHSRDDK